MRLFRSKLVLDPLSPMKRVYRSDRRLEKASGFLEESAQDRSEQ